MNCLTRRMGLCLSGLLLVPAYLLAAEPSKGWPSWRGPNHDGISKETGLLKTWPADGPPLVWQVKGLGRGYSSVSISGGKIFTMGQRRRSTDLIALDLATGKELWSTKIGGGSPNCTPTVDGNHVYALSKSGDFLCVKTSDGSVVWKKNFRRDFGGRMMSGWGYSESPLIDGDRVVCTPGAKDAMIVALDKKTGKVIWKAPLLDDIGRRGRDGAGYSSIVISKAAGVKQYVQLTGKGVISVAAKDGKPLWAYNRVANSTANIPTPIVTGDYVFCSSGYGTGAALLKVVKDGDSVKAEEKYFLNSRTLQNHHGGMILVDGYVYCGHGHNQGYPICVELKTGKVQWGGRGTRGPGTRSAAIVFADGHFYFRYQNGVMGLIEATPKEYKLKGSFKLPSVNGPSWPHPVIFGGKLYLRDNDTLMCFNVRKK